MAPLPPPPPPPPRLPPPSVRPIAPALGAHDYDHERSRWGIPDAILAFLIFFFASLIFGFVWIIVEGVDATLSGPWLPVLVVGPALCQIVYVTWAARSKGQGLAKDFRAEVRFSDAAVGAALCISALILAGITAAAMMAIFDQEPNAAVADLIEDSEDDSSGLTVWIYLMAALGAIAIPIIEEIVFRGLWWSALEKKGLNQWATLAITSLIFAVAHFEPWRTPILFVLGAVIGVGRIATGRIGASIFAHMYVNAIGMTFLLIELS